MIYVWLATYMYKKMIPDRIIEWQLPLLVIVISLIVARLMSLLIKLIKLPIKKKSGSVKPS